MNMDYESIKDLAKELKVPVTQLVALSPQNDPFYVGTPRDRSLGLWFRDLWDKFGYTSGVHIRRMHYAIVSQNPPVCFPNGKPYENTEGCWSELANAAKAARYLEYVDPAAFVDRRNDDPVDYVDYATTKAVQVDISVDEIENIELPETDELPTYSISAFTSPQQYHLEIWCEKSTMNDILEPLVSSYGATLVYGKGELSITAAVQAIERYKRSDKPVRIFYVSDFDPAGAGMPVSMSRKLEYFARRMELDLDIKLFPVVLTYDQTKQYPRLLPTPIKETERRKANFEAKYGGGGVCAVELDALEALYPGELRRILEQEMDRYYDHTLKRRVTNAWYSLYQDLDATKLKVLAQYETEIASLDNQWQAIRASFQGVQQQMESYIEARNKTWQAISDEMNIQQPAYTVDEVPAPNMAIERESPLYDSSRDYLSQNLSYQAHKQHMGDESASA